MSTKFMVCYLLDGEIKTYHEDLVGHIAREFQTRPIHQRMASHVTLKPPFNTENVEEVEDVVKQIANSNRAPTIAFDGFGHFKHRTIFLDVIPSAEAHDLVVDLTRRLEKLSWMPPNDRDVAASLHATVANHNIQQKFNDVWNLVTEDAPRFETLLDNLTILYHQDKRWYTHKQFLLAA